MQSFKYKYPIIFNRNFYIGLAAGLFIYFVLAQIIFNPFGIRKFLVDDKTFTFSRIESHFSVPEGETGSIFEVANSDKLKVLNSTLFSNVKDGDKIVIYGSIAVIYNVNEDKIINIINLSKEGITN